mgnify:FL=1
MLVEAGLLAAGAGLLVGAAAVLSAVDRHVFARALFDRFSIATALAALLGWLLAGLISGAWLGAACIAAGGVTAVSIARGDWQRGEIADLSSLLLAGLGLGYALTPLSPISALEAGLGAVLSAMLIGLAALFVRLRRGSPGLGDGDILLCAACGFWCGVWAVGPALLIAAGVTAAGALLARIRAEAALPFAPGLLTGYAVLTLYEGLT